MKSMKKILSLVMALAIVLSMGVGALAVDPLTNGTITVKNVPAETGISISGETFNVYKIFNVTYSGTDNDGKPTNYAYTVATGLEEFFSDHPEYMPDKLEIMINSEANAFAKVLREYILDNKISAAGSGTVPVYDEPVIEESVIIGGLDLGYYLVLGGGNAEQGDEYNSDVTSLAMLDTTIPNMTVNLKASAPTLTKEVRYDFFGLDADWSSWNKAADYEIGENVDYRLTTYVPDTNGYSDYTFILADTLPSGLSSNNDIRVFISGPIDDDTNLSDLLLVDLNKLTPLVAGTDYTLNTSPTTGETFTITIPKTTLDKYQVPARQKRQEIVVVYSALVTSDALIYTDVNINTATLEYSNDPYTKETNKIDDTAKVYSYDLEILKCDKEDNTITLAGAEFNLYAARQIVPEGDSSSTEIKELVSVYEVTEGSGNYKIYDGKKEGVTLVTKMVTPASGLIHIDGLDEGTYYLVEIKAPDGYNKLDDEIIVNISTLFTPGSGDYDRYIDIAEIEYSVEYNGSYEELESNQVKVENSTGAILPSTGGIGTTIFYVIGSALVLLAVVLLVVKNRKNKVYEE